MRTAAVLAGALAAALASAANVQTLAGIAAAFKAAAPRRTVGYYGLFSLADYWQLELETLHEIADGIVIWGGVDIQHADRRRPWDEAAPWWGTTQALMAKWHLQPSPDGRRR